MTELIIKVQDELDESKLAPLKAIATHDLKPVRPAEHIALRVAKLWTLFCAVVLSMALFGYAGVRALGWLHGVPYFMLLVFATALACAALAAETRPAAKRLLNASSLIAIALVLLCAFVAAAFPDLSTYGFFRIGHRCFSLGLSAAAIAGLCAALALRRSFLVAPIRVGAVAGFFSGLTGVTVLAIHCPLLTIPHILVWHVSVLPASVAIGLFIFWVIQKISALRN